MNGTYDKMLNLKVNPKLTVNSFFYIALFLYAFRYFMNNSMFSYDGIVPNSFLRLLQVTIFILLLLKILLSKYKPRVLFIMTLICVVTAFSAMSSDRLSLMVTVMLVLASYKMEYKKIFRWDLIFMLFFGAIVVFSGLSGFITNKFYSGRGYCYGFYYFSYLGFLVYAVCGVLLFLKKKCSYFTLIVIAGINFLIYTLCGSRTPFLMSMFLVIGYLLCEKINIFSFKKKVWKWVAILLYPSAYLGVFVFLSLYSNGVFDTLRNSSLWGTMILRIRNSLNGIQEYGIHLFGYNYDMSQHGYYLDSGYVALLVIYGVFFAIVLVCLYSLIFRFIYETNSKFLYIWMLTCFVGCFSTNLLLNPIENPVMFLMPCAIEDFLYKSKRLQTTFSNGEDRADSAIITS